MNVLINKANAIGAAGVSALAGTDYALAQTSLAVSGVEVVEILRLVLVVVSGIIGWITGKQTEKKRKDKNK